MTEPHEAGRPLERVRPGPEALYPVRTEGRSGIVLDHGGQPHPMVRLRLNCAHDFGVEEPTEPTELELWLPASYARQVVEILNRQITAGEAEAEVFRARGN